MDKPSASFNEANTGFIDGKMAVSFYFSSCRYCFILLAAWLLIYTSRGFTIWIGEVCLSLLSGRTGDKLGSCGLFRCAMNSTILS